MICRAESSTAVKVSRALAFAVLSDYDLYGDWLPDVARSRTLDQEGELALVELLVSPLGHGPLVLEVVETPTSRVAFKQVDSYRRRGVRGRWELSESHGGRSVVVRASIEAEGRLFGRCRRTLQGVVERSLEAFARRAYRIAAGEFADDPKARRKVLEVASGPQGLEVWLRGERFVLCQATADEEER